MNKDKYKICNYTRYYMCIECKNKYYDKFSN